MKRINISRCVLGIIASLAFSISMTPPASAGKVYEIDQVMDMRALTPEDLYQFVPNYYWIEPGDVIRFLNSTGNHSVKSTPGIWPEGAERVDLQHKESYDVKMTVPGVYGFKCKVHSRHGMFALVVVGSPDSNLKQVEFTNMNDRAVEVFKGLFEKLESDRAGRGQ